MHFGLMINCRTKILKFEKKEGAFWFLFRYSLSQILPFTSLNFWPCVSKHNDAGGGQTKLYYYV